jgi:hypothetical protein
VTYATGSIQSGSWLIGKNVPENRNRGTMRNRNRVERLLPSFWVSVQAVMAVVNATPVSTAGGMAVRAGPISRAPNNTAMTANTSRVKRSRPIPQISRPQTMSAGPRGVVTVPWKFFRHKIPAITGKEPSPAPFCMALAAISPLATKARYGIDSVWPDPSSTSVPSPAPMAARKNTGLTNEVITVPRQVRR